MNVFILKVYYILCSQFPTSHTKQNSIIIKTVKCAHINFTRTLLYLTLEVAALLVTTNHVTHTCHVTNNNCLSNNFFECKQ